MDEKSNNLIQSLGKAYEDQTVKHDPDLIKIIAACARSLMGNSDDKVYFEVITKLTHGVSKYSESNRKSIPEAILNIFQQINKDIPKHSINADKLHQLAVDSGMSFIKA